MEVVRDVFGGGGLLGIYSENSKEYDRGLVPAGSTKTELHRKTIGVPTPQSSGIVRLRGTGRALIFVC